MENKCTELRNKVKEIAEEVLALKKDSKLSKDTPEEFTGQNGEIFANIMITYRHLEDARMRIGKVMQQLQGGTSIFDKQEQDKLNK